MGRLVHIDVEVVVSKDGAADRRDAGGLLADAQLIDDLGDHAVHDTVAAAGAVMERHVRQDRSSFKNNCHVYASLIFRMRSAMSSAVGMMLPALPMNSQGLQPLTARRISSYICPSLISTVRQPLTLS